MNHSFCIAHIHYRTKFHISTFYCEEHSVVYCHCGYEFGQHPIHVIYNPKKTCFSCGCEIDTDGYEMRGNYCAKCHNRSTKRRTLH